MKQFNNWSETKLLKDIVTNPLIEVGNGSYYSGYYANQDFEDGCVRYLWGDKKQKIYLIQLKNLVGRWISLSLEIMSVLLLVSPF